MNYLIYVLFAVAPSLIWLAFFLKRDKNPESEKMILKVFALGGGTAILAGCAQIGLTEILGPLFNGQLVFSFLLYHFIIIALVEEFLKYFMVKTAVLSHSEFDEPVDAMIYMIVVALGFAAVENFIYLVNYEGFFGSSIYQYALTLSAMRFVGATLLHALSSAIVGLFIALSFLKIKKKMLFTSFGIFFATILHGLYNLFIMGEEKSSFMLSFVILVFLAFFILYYAFWKVKKLKSICKI